MKIYYSASDLAEMLDISKSKAYGIIKEMNAELAQSGYIVLAGKVPIAYFDKKWYGLEQTRQELQGAI